MIDRRGFLKLLGALGAATAAPIQTLLAAPEADLPVDEMAGEGMWWIPNGGSPMRLEVSSFEVRNDIEHFDGGRGYMESRLVGSSTIGLTLTRLEGLEKFYGGFQTLQRGTLRARLKYPGGVRQYEWRESYVTQIGMEYGYPADPSTIELTVATGSVTESA